MKEVPLYDSAEKALVDDADYERVCTMKWHILDDKGRLYAQASIRKNDQTYTTISLHRFIMTPSQSQVVDHINHNGLDCRRENMRLVTHAQNVHNSRPHNGRRYKGVYPKNGRFQAAYNNRHLGTYDTAVEAAIVYNKAVFEQNGDYAFLNKLPSNSFEVANSFIGFRLPPWIHLEV